MCLRCSCVGHMAGRCIVEPRRSPHRRKLHIRSKRMDKYADSSTQPVVSDLRTVSEASLVHSRPWPSLSIALSPESEKLRKELARVAVLTLTQGFVNEVNLLAVIPSIINKKLASPATPLNDCTFLLPMESREEFKDLCKLGSETKNGPCILNIST